MSAVDSSETMGMWNSILAVLFSLLLGLVGLGAAVWQIVTLQVVHSLDNIFLTLCGLLMALVGFGYVAMVLAPAFSKTPDKKAK
jgi:uncharacterized protein YybS (DUF2232 family)